MTLPPEPSPDDTPDASLESPSDLQDFEQGIADAERSLQTLKERYAQVQQDAQTQAQLQERQATIQQQVQHTPTPELKAELTRIQAQLETLAVNLESHLFSWGSLKEPFWQIIRFGGFGLVVGWLLAFAALQSPRPTPPAVNTPSQSVQP